MAEFIAWSIKLSEELPMRQVLNFMQHRVKHSCGSVALAASGVMIAPPAMAHPDVTSPAGAMAWLMSALIGLGIVAAIWWSARR